MAILRARDPRRGYALTEWDSRATSRGRIGSPHRALCAGFRCVAGGPAARGEAGASVVGEWRLLQGSANMTHEVSRAANMWGDDDGRQV